MLSMSKSLLISLHLVERAFIFILFDVVLLNEAQEVEWVQNIKDEWNCSIDNSDPNNIRIKSSLYHKFIFLLYSED